MNKTEYHKLRRLLYLSRHRKIEALDVNAPGYSAAEAAVERRSAEDKCLAIEEMIRPRVNPWWEMFNAREFSTRLRLWEMRQRQWEARAWDRIVSGLVESKRIVNA